MQHVMYILKYLLKLAFIAFAALKDEIHTYEEVKTERDLVNLYECIKQEARDRPNEYINTELTNSGNNT